MAWTLPRTWVVAEVVTEALMNTHVRDDLRYLKGLDGRTDFEDAIGFISDVSPAQIIANQNDYSPASMANAVVLRLSTDASRNITGFATGVDGRILIVVNVGSFNIVLTDEDALSLAANRFALSANVTILPDQGVALVYDSTSSRWRSPFITPVISHADLTGVTSGQHHAQLHAAAHQPAGADAMAVDAAAATGSLRTIGSGALQAMAGNTATGAKITKGTYVGDDALDRAIPHGLGNISKLVIIQRIEVTLVQWNIFESDNGFIHRRNSGAGTETRTAVAAMDATNFYVGNNEATWKGGNASNMNMAWIAIG